jgi:hypothetical protein
LIGAEHRTALGDLLQGSAIASGVENLRGRSVLIASADPFLVALALIELDGLARRVTLYPSDLSLVHAVRDALRRGRRGGIRRCFLASPSARLDVYRSWSRAFTPAKASAHRWILLTSGSGRPRWCCTHWPTAGAIRQRVNTEVIWGTFYDIRRYGGLPIYLRAVLTRSSLLLTGPQELVANFLQRAGEAGVTHISGTPSHWRRALMSPAADRIAPRYIRLSGEIADQAILNSLRSFYPDAEISHAFATTEAGVAFDVRDALSGFPASMLTGTSGVDWKVVDATLRVRSSRTAERYLGENQPVLKDPEGFVDTGDVLELRDGRYHFQGRRDGVINVGGLKVHPEEVEAVLNRHPQVRLSLVKTKKNPITGALVVTDVLLKDPSTPEGEQARELQQTIKQFCRESLAPHKVPAAISFVPALAISETGKLVRRHA